MLQVSHTHTLGLLVYTGIVLKHSEPLTSEDALETLHGPSPHVLPVLGCSYKFASWMVRNANMYICTIPTADYNALMASVYKMWGVDVHIQKYQLKPSLTKYSLHGEKCAPHLSHMDSYRVPHCRHLAAGQFRDQSVSSQWSWAGGGLTALRAKDITRQQGAQH